MLRQLVLFCGVGLLAVAGAAGQNTCQFFLQQGAPSVTVGSNGGTFSLTLSANAPGGATCSWQAVSSATWVQVFPLSGSFVVSPFNLTGDFPVQYTVFPNFSPVPRNATIQLGGLTISVVQAPGGGNAYERYIRLLYFNLMGRLPTLGELGYHVVANINRTDLALGFFSAPEFLTGGRFVAGLYLGLLGRDPEFSGWLFQRNALGTGATTQRQLVTNFLGSNEFITKYGTLSNAQFVALMYQQVLGRPATQAEIDYHVTAMTAGMTRTDIALNFLNSTEFQVASTARLNAYLIYFAFIMRDPTPAERDALIGQLSSGMSLRTALDAVVNDPEFLTMIAGPNWTTPFTP